MERSVYCWRYIDKYIGMIDSPALDIFKNWNKFLAWRMNNEDDLNKLIPLPVNLRFAKKFALIL